MHPREEAERRASIHLQTLAAPGEPSRVNASGRQVAQPSPPPPNAAHPFQSFPPSPVSTHNAPAATRIGQPITCEGFVHLSFGTGKICTFKEYTVHCHDGRTCVHISATSTATVDHFIPEEPNDIPYTTPGDPEFKARFLPLKFKHTFHIRDRPDDTGYRQVEEAPTYRFTDKNDRETFQKELRGRKTLGMFRTSEIHYGTGRNRLLVTGVHVKIWRRGESDDEATFSFAHLGSGTTRYQGEYKIRWFKRYVTMHGDRLVLDVRLPETQRKSFSFGIKQSPTVPPRRPSGGTGLPSNVLYDTIGLDPPQKVRQLERIETKFLNDEYRNGFISTSMDAHSFTLPLPFSSQSNSNIFGDFSATWTASQLASMPATPQSMLIQSKGKRPASTEGGSSPKRSFMLPDPAASQNPVQQGLVDEDDEERSTVSGGTFGTAPTHFENQPQYASASSQRQIHPENRVSPTDVRFGNLPGPAVRDSLEAISELDSQPTETDWPTVSGLS